MNACINFGHILLVYVNFRHVLHVYGHSKLWYIQWKKPPQWNSSNSGESVNQMNNFGHRRITIQMPFADDRDALQQVFMQCHANEKHDVGLQNTHWLDLKCSHNYVNNAVIMFTQHSANVHATITICSHTPTESETDSLKINKPLYLDKLLSFCNCWPDE